MATTDPTRTPTRTVERALSLLAEVAGHDGIGLAEAARNTELSPSTALRLLRTLEATEFVRRSEDGAYHVGSRLIQVAVTSMGSAPLYRRAEPHLEALRDATGETAYLGVLGPQHTALYARLAESDQPIRHVSWLGKTVPMEGTAIGSALRGLCGPEGYVTTRHTLEDDATAMAATAYWPDGTVAAALSVVGPTFRIPDSKMQAVGELVAEHAAGLTRELGSPAE
jgi:DNA-binding IclR family transcriptional regulator